MKASVCAVVAIGSCLVPSVAFCVEWEDLSVNSLNRLPPRTYAMPLADESAALSDAVEPPSPYVKSLNGTWKFSWAGNPALRIADFWRTDFDEPTGDTPSR